MGDYTGRGWSPLVTKLSQFVPLSDNDISVIEALSSREQHFGGNVDIFVEGEAPRFTFVISDGMACRYRILADGRRQILTFLIPGDFVCLHAFLLKSIDHFISTIGRTQLALVDRDSVIDIVTKHPRIRAALWWSARQRMRCCPPQASAGYSRTTSG